MNSKEDEKWQSLLSRSTPTFTGDAVPPYGLMTRTLAQLKAERRQQEEFERIGWRALLASFTALIAVVSLTVGLQLRDRGDLEPGVSSIIEVENMPIS